ncbi:hypothetical protein [Herbidospora daliensis]|uniref:hypothetical protein n=1 Tax=Herbidospora daliensis TaxID=295585 RepID=UPI000783D58C|nr:hypothetical protein [Herbidospora daliensis]
MGSAYATSDWRSRNIHTVTKALDGLELTDEDKAAITWLSRWKPETVATLALTAATATIANQDTTAFLSPGAADWNRAIEGRTS